MKQLCEKLQKKILNTYSLASKIKFSSTNSGKKINILPQFEKLTEKETFEISVLISWRSIKVEFKPGRSAGKLVRNIQKKNKNNLNNFKHLMEQVEKMNFKFIFKINNNDKNPLDEKTWKETWNNIYFQIKYPPIVVDESDKNELFDNVWNIVCISLDLLETWKIFSNIPREDNHGLVQKGLPEGAVKKIEINKYERSTINRNICLREYGYLCQICGFDFEEKYGKVGKDFIHVHHITPVSMMGEDYVVNPVKDLIPVCPNCHSMIHRKDPPYTIEDMKQKLR